MGEKWLSCPVRFSFWFDFSGFVAMSNTHHFFDLDASSPIPAVVVLFGRDAFLRRLAGEQVKAGVLGQDADVPYAKLTGSVATWADVADEVNTMSLFGGSGRRLVVLEEADSFVTKFRDELEKFLERKRSGGVLVLQVDRWAANTRLYKKCDELGLQIECNPPEKKAGKRPVLDGPRLAKWFVTRTPALHGAKITSGAVEQLIELLGPELGLIDQEIERLALFVEVGGTIDEQLVLEQVHGGQLQEMWNLVDAAVEGQSSEAILQLDRFFQAGTSRRNSMDKSPGRFAGTRQRLESSKGASVAATPSHFAMPSSRLDFPLGPKPWPRRNVGSSCWGKFEEGTCSARCWRSTSP